MLCPCRSPKKLSFQPLKGKNPKDAATPIFIKWVNVAERMSFLPTVGKYR
jgi:hypothetical protein